MSAASSRKNRKLLAILLGVALGGVGLSFAFVPLYQIFCQVTGWDGTPQRAEEAPGAVAGKTITVRFNADVNGGLPWSFAPVERQVTVAIGETALVFYRVTNQSDEPIVGTATFNVTPLKAGPYFAKLDCFCFTEQTLQPGQTVDMPVSFFVDPAILDDPELAHLPPITLSYTFFRAQASEPRVSAAPALPAGS